MRINIRKEFFREKEFVFLENGQFKVTFFRYSTGVEAIKVENSKGYFIILPFQGQQIWRAGFLGHELTMKTKFDEPVPTLEYLKTYGGFLLHCGICAFGVPQADDNHPQHGEIPNAPYQRAYIECEEDYVAVGGYLDYDVSFTRNYTFRPECRLYKDDTVLKLHMQLENRRTSPMEYMYLCHINFCRVEGAKLMYSTPYDSDHVKVYKSVGDNLPEEHAKKLRDYMDKLEKDPSLHHVIDAPGQIYDPEICFMVMYDGDEENRAYTLQYNEEGACYVNHPVDVLPYAIRWMSKTGDEASCGMVLPCTAEHLGYQNAKRKGMIKTLSGNETLEFTIEAGYLDKPQADAIIAAKGLK